MKTVLAAVSVCLLAMPAMAAQAPSVPEIDALSGLAALSVVGGAMTLIWERRRRK